MDRVTTSNLLLRSLDTEDRARVIRSGERVSLEVGDVVGAPGKVIGDVYFLESGFASVVAGEDIGVGMVGREGMCGYSLALGSGEMPFRVVVQGRGSALRVPGRTFERLCREITGLQRLALAYSEVVTIQVAETAHASVRCSVEARLARWLVMARDRLDADQFPITHDTLSRTLGVRRPGVTVALHVLEGEHMIKAQRGLLTILDREKLAQASKGSYGWSKSEYQRIFSGAQAAVAA